MERTRSVRIMCIFVMLRILVMVFIALGCVVPEAGLTSDTIDAPTADLLTVNFYESDIRQALLAMAMDRNANVMMAPDVSGKVTVYLRNVTLDEAISSIAASGGFSCRKEKSSYFIFKTKDKLDAQAERLQVKVFKLKFAKTEKVQEILSSFPGIRTVKIHDDTKTIIVEDTPENIAKVEAIINAWDSPPRQVLIEANILEVELKDDMKLGVDWTKLMGSLSITTGSNFSTQAAGGLSATLQIARGTSSEFSAALAALESKTKVNTLSTPKILAIHGKPARVQVGGKTGYKTTVTNLGVTQEQIMFIDTGTILDITAYISDENNILLSVQPQISSVSLDPVTQIPTVKTTNVSTSLMTKSGQTIFIGGLIMDTVSKERQTVPLLGQIPLLGAFFGFSHPYIEKTELIVLITPTLMEEEIDQTSKEAARKFNSLNEGYKKNPPNNYNELLK